MNWCVKTQHANESFDLTKYSLHEYSADTKKFLATLINITLFRRCGISYFEHSIGNTYSSFVDKVNKFTKEYGMSWENSQMFLSVYDFSDEQITILLDIRNILN